MTSVRSAALAAVAVVVVVAWSWRPPTPISGRSPTLLVPGADSARVVAMMDSLFSELGAPVDTVQLADSQLRIALYPGTFTRPMRLVAGSCTNESQPLTAMRRAAVIAYRMYGMNSGVERVEVRVNRSDSTLTGGWGRRETCGPGGGASLYFYRPELDSAITSVKRTS